MRSVTSEQSVFSVTLKPASRPRGWLVGPDLLSRVSEGPRYKCISSVAAAHLTAENKVIQSLDVFIAEMKQGENLSHMMSSKR